MKNIISIILLAVLPVLHAQDAKEIMCKSRDAMKISSFEATSTLTLYDGRGNQRVRQNSMASMSDPDGTEKRIIRFLAPAEVKGTGILIYDHPEKSDDMWVYLPALRKTRRIAGSERSRSFMGSEFSNANMTAPGLNDFQYSVTGSEIIDGSECWKIISVPLSADLEDEYGYSRSVSWINKNDYIVRQTEYYDLDGELFKTIRTESYRLLDSENKKYMITSMIAENHKNGRKSVMKMDRVEPVPTKSEYFTVAYLEKL